MAFVVQPRGSSLGNRFNVERFTQKPSSEMPASTGKDFFWLCAGLEQRLVFKAAAEAGYESRLVLFKLYFTLPGGQALSFQQHRSGTGFLHCCRAVALTVHKHAIERYGLIFPSVAILGVDDERTLEEACGCRA